jgi:hypothetical protein
MADLLFPVIYCADLTVLRSSRVVKPLADCWKEFASSVAQYLLERIERLEQFKRFKPFKEFKPRPSPRDV